MDAPDIRKPKPAWYAGPTFADTLGCSRRRQLQICQAVSRASCAAASYRQRDIDEGRLVVRPRRQRSDAGKKRRAKGKNVVSADVVDSSDDDDNDGLEPTSDEEHDNAQRGGNKKRKTMSTTAAHSSPSADAASTSVGATVAPVLSIQGPASTTGIAGTPSIIPAPAGVGSSTTHAAQPIVDLPATRKRKSRKKAGEIENTPAVLLHEPYITRANRVSRPTAKALEAAATGDFILGRSRLANVAQ